MVICALAARLDVLKDFVNVRFGDGGDGLVGKDGKEILADAPCSFLMVIGGARMIAS